MTDDVQEQQPVDVLLAGAITMQVEQRIQRRISPFEVDGTPETIAPGVTIIHVQSMPNPDAYHVCESTAGPDGLEWHAYRTVQRIDLATRLTVAANYDPADLVGRMFVVES
jgi:hypothetical protein